MIILDTSFLVSFYNKDDDNYDKAWEIMQYLISGKYGDVCISDYIFDECVTVLFSRLKDLEKVAMICETIKKVKIFKVNSGLFDDSWRIFKEQKNTKFSFTDCTILALMRWHGIKNIATFDEDFEKIKDINVVS